MELLLVEGIRGCIYSAGCCSSRFEDYSFERRCFVGIMEEMVTDLEDC
jgi:hypothetical protein